MTIMERVRGTWRKTRDALTPSEPAWRGAAVAISLVAAVVVLAMFAGYYLQHFSVYKLPAFFVRVGSLLLLGIVALWILALIGRVPLVFRVALFVFAPLVVLLLSPSGGARGAAVGVGLLLAVSLIGAGINVLRRRGIGLRGHGVTLTALTLGVLGLAGGLYAIFSEIGPTNPSHEGFMLEDRTLALPNPGLPGEHTVLTLTYGSGEDRHRAEYGADADLVSRRVDGSKLIDNWDGFTGWLRTRFWGFDATALPLQARVWYPDGGGPFPLVLVVHGNHAMEDFSDPGYAYLGELLASRGIILASVDENFLNSSSSARVDLLADRPGLEEENDARGWVLLEHLALWRDWNSDPEHPFYGKVDMDRVALIGHSRGGEAVAIAAAFNSLSRYPDDATLDFDFGFNLRGVIAIAPVDGQYRPRERGTPIRDVNYFTIHGSMDGDVESFEGTAQYSRVSFSDDDRLRFKASLYVAGANHGQFNTTWENLDTNVFRAWALDLDRIMDPEAQRDVARVFFSAFLEIVLRDRFEYLPMFADARHAANWLPDTFYISQFTDSRQRPIADFEEDIEPATATMGGARIETKNLTKWYETYVELKWDPLDTHAAVFAWDSRAMTATPRVDFALPDGPAVTDMSDTLVFSLSAADIGTLPDDVDADSVESASNEDETLDWSVVLRDREGARARLPLSHDQVLYPQYRAVPRRAEFLAESEPNEVIFRRYEFPLADFVAANPAFDPARLATISFVFDVSEKGAIVVDDLSIR